MDAKSAVGAGAALLVVGGAAGWLLCLWQQGSAGDDRQARIAELEARIRSDAGEADRKLREARDAAEKARTEAQALDARLRERIAQVEEARGETNTVRGRLAEAEAELARFRGDAEAAKRPKLAFAFPEFADALEAVDWGSVALHTTAIVGPIREITDAILAGKPVPLQAAGEAQKHNGPLIQSVGALGGRLSGTGPNGSYTHPAFQVNAIAAALQHLGLPLSDAQRTTLEDLGRRFSEEERKRVGAYDDTTFQMRKLVEEGDLRGRFFDAVRAALTPVQLDALSPPSTRDRLGADLWSEGLLWVTVTRQVNFTKREQFTDTVARTLGPLFRLDDAQKAKLAGTVADWAAHLPQTLVERDLDALEKAGMAPADLVAAAAGETRKLVERAATDLNLTGESLAAARRWGVVFYPVPGEDE
jgi:hypothetical protein